MKINNLQPFRKVINLMKNTNSEEMKSWPEKLGYGIMLIILSLIPTYLIMVFGLPQNQIDRQIAFFKADSMYFNPWQYRILSPFLVEGFHILLLKIVGSQLTYLTSIKYFFTLQSFLLNVSAWLFYKKFTNNRPLCFAGVLLLANGMIASAIEADIFNFNTYFDIIFYTWATWIIFSGTNRWWFLPLTFFAALNRETSLLLPLLLLLDYPALATRKLWFRQLGILTCCLLIYVVIFFAIRLHYGYQPPAPIGIETGLPMLHFNLTDPETITLLFSMLTVLPLFALFNIRKVDFRLQILFWLIVPAWFGIHFWLVWAREIRIFSVPFTIVFIPIVLDLIQKSFEKAKAS